MEKTCAICQIGLEPGHAITVCPGCKSEYHQGCWQENRGCATYGCPNAPPALKREGILPGEQAYWGATTKTCPACGETIGVGELVCPFCRERFESPTPLTPEDMQRHAGGHRPLATEGRTGALLLFILSLFGCTAPFILLVGGIWYAQNGRKLREGSPLHRILALVGLGIAGFYCLIFIVGSLLNLKR